jgi:hypothetical protein
MKKLFVVLTLLCSTAQAGEFVEKWLEMQQKDGSRVQLHLDNCRNPEKGKAATYIAPNGKVTGGCWTLVAGMTYVEWANGELVAYDRSLFSRREEKWPTK